MNHAVPAHVVIALAALAGAPAASTPILGLAMAALWCALLLISALAGRTSRRLGATEPASSMAGAIVSLTLVAAGLLLQPILTDSPPIPSGPTSVLLALIAPLASPHVARAPLALFGVPALILILAGSLRPLLPPMEAAAGAALGLALLATLATLAPRMLPGPDAPHDSR